MRFVLPILLLLPLNSADAQIRMPQPPSAVPHLHLAQEIKPQTKAGKIRALQAKIKAKSREMAAYLDKYKIGDLNDARSAAEFKFRIALRDVAQAKAAYEKNPSDENAKLLRKAQEAEYAALQDLQLAFEKNFARGFNGLTPEGLSPEGKFSPYLLLLIDLIGCQTELRELRGG